MSVLAGVAYFSFCACSVRSYPVGAWKPPLCSFAPCFAHQSKSTMWTGCQVWGPGYRDPASLKVMKVASTISGMSADRPQEPGSWLRGCKPTRSSQQWQGAANDHGKKVFAIFAEIPPGTAQFGCCILPSGLWSECHGHSPHSPRVVFG